MIILFREINGMRIYADHAATTAMSGAAIDAMTRCMREEYGNPSSLYRIGQRAKETLEQAREETAAVFHERGRRLFRRRENCGSIMERPGKSKRKTGKSHGVYGLHEPPEDGSDRHPQNLKIFYKIVKNLFTILSFMVYLIRSVFEVKSKTGNTSLSKGISIRRRR